ncbi:CoA transferase [Pseudomonas fluorescens]|uniref:CoA transferase n=2 Tax=Pseudomonas fluorescens TaxID=294 RepID=A0A327MR18_PSEFL|nr:CaiB/BaiF CoA-transferase family protein [Pseudomonas fluorescens]RAI64879.1 CoA transferase [Pseudomonas fluorescens]
MNNLRPGPLSGLRVLEFASIGPGPHCVMQLADMGADVVRIERPGGNGWPNDVADRGRRIVTLDIRTEEGQSTCLSLLKDADVLVEGFRPGVMERLGLGPEVMRQHNPRLVYGRITGWGQDGPLAKAAGHDINYIALSGALSGIGSSDAPATPPLNLVGDFGGGSMFLLAGILAALLERERSGLGQTVDAAIVDGCASLMSFFSGQPSASKLDLRRGQNLLGGAAPYYRVYRCSDGKEIAIGALEPAFYGTLVKLSGADEELLIERDDPLNWPKATPLWEQLFFQRSRDEWCEILEGTDACFAPVLSISEAQNHPHIVARASYQELDGFVHSSPAPRFSRTPSQVNASRRVTIEDAVWECKSSGM